jgi:hypothetical protein
MAIVARIGMTNESVFFITLPLAGYW